MNILNIHNKGRKLFLFLRDSNGELTIKEDNTFHPYFYQKDEEKGIYKAFDGAMLSKKFVSEPKDVRQYRNEESYEADVNYSKKYILDKIDKFDKTKIKWALWDIEVWADEFPIPRYAKYPISCISIYNSFEDKVKTWWLLDYDKDEKKMLLDFIDYLKKESIDLILAWNIKFDYSYIHHRLHKLLGKSYKNDFGKLVGYKGLTRRAEWGELMNESDKEDTNNVWFPIGSSWVDLMQWYKKITLNRRQAYNLNFIAQEDLGEKDWGDEDFGDLAESVKEKNINDVMRMKKLIDKKNIINYFDTLRRDCKLPWEDLYFNYRIIDNRMLMLAKEMDLILPSKKSAYEQEDFEGAYREAHETGRFEKVNSYDLSGAYLYTIMDLCLDTTNIREEPNENTLKIKITDRVSNETIKEIYVEQNFNTLLPTLAKTLVTDKNITKKELQNTSPNDLNYQIKKEEYDSKKSISLSAWGVVGNKTFRLYDANITSLITSVIRDLSHYIEDKIKPLGYKVIYNDTDGFIIDDKGENIVDLLNSLIREWSQERFNKNSQIQFEHQGTFKNLIILGKTRYEGILVKDGVEQLERKGIEVKRSDSSKYIKEFQATLLKKIREGEPKEQILKWIQDEKDNFSTKDIFEISFPAKLREDYKNLPIHARALEDSPIEKRTGQLYWWIYTKSRKVGIKKIIKHYLNGSVVADNTYNGWLQKLEEGEKKISYRKKEYDLATLIEKVETKEEEIDHTSNVIAFDKKNFEHVKKEDIDWNLMVGRNINNKSDKILEAMGWKNE